MIDDPDFLRSIDEIVIQEILEMEMNKHIGAAPYERSKNRKGRRNGYKPRILRTRVGKLNLLVPQDREGNSPLLSLAATSARRRHCCCR